ncbi:MAG: NRDE family protein [Bacteroidota bacterium]
MCTVTYLPTGNNSFILTSNRDEHHSRPLAIAPSNYQIKDVTLSFPKDPLGGGTWIAVEKNKTVVCLLNGAFVSHTRKSEYRKSRGLVVLEFFDYENADVFSTEYNFEDIEPFTMIIVNNDNHIQLNELRWDGENVHLKKMDANLAAIWSSCTLYDEGISAMRNRWFEEWFANKSLIEFDHVQSFHQYAGKDDVENGLVMTRLNGMRTVSITSIICQKDASEIHYADLINNQNYLHRI